VATHITTDGREKLPGEMDKYMLKLCNWLHHYVIGQKGRIPVVQIHLTGGPDTALFGSVVDSIDRVDGVIKQLCQFGPVLGVIATNDYLSVPLRQDSHEPRAICAPRSNAFFISSGNTVSCRAFLASGSNMVH